MTHCGYAHAHAHVPPLREMYAILAPRRSLGTINHAIKLRQQEAIVMIIDTQRLRYCQVLQRADGYSCFFQSKPTTEEARDTA